jgi:hypothetical protein
MRPITDFLSLCIEAEMNSGPFVPPASHGRVETSFYEATEGAIASPRG